MLPRDITQEPKHLVAASEAGVVGSAPPVLAPEAATRDHMAPRGPPGGKAATPETKAKYFYFSLSGLCPVPVLSGASFLLAAVTPTQAHSTFTDASPQAKTRPVTMRLTPTCLPGSSCDLAPSDQTYFSHRLENKEQFSHSASRHRTSSSDTGLRQLQSLS